MIPRSLPGILRRPMAQLSIACLLLASFSAIAAAGSKPEDVVAAHLASIGTAEVRAAVKSRAVQGSLHFTVTFGGGGQTGGQWQLLSAEHKSKFVMKFGDAKWWGEEVVCDGGKPFVSITTASRNRSAFGSFLANYDWIVRDGLLGGELNGSWALEDLERNHVKLEYMGIKKVDGRDLEGLEYISKNNGIMTVKLYFEPETHHHVLTVYTVVQAASIVHSSIANARQEDLRFSVEERFSDFQTDAGITLARQYDLRYTQQLQNGNTVGYDWLMTVDKVVENPIIDPANFQAK